MSGKTEHRPEFKRLCFDMFLPGREWQTILTVDVARLSRKLSFFTAFQEATDRLGIDRRYADFSETEGILSKHEELMLAIFAQHHSNACRDKGKAGMAMNIMQKHRAGGIAPRGYRLLKVQQDKIRGGIPVTKTRLELIAEEAEMIRLFLKGRALGVPRKRLQSELQLPWPKNSLVDIEWNALTYAGYTVWNRNYENDKGYGYHGQGKYRPRSEWLLSDEVTHQALITKDEAETIISALERTTHSPYRNAKARKAQLFTGLLTTEEGRNWQCNSGAGYYQAPKVDGKKLQMLKQCELDPILLLWISNDIQKDEFIRQVIATRKSIDKDPEYLFSVLRINALSMQLNINQENFDLFPDEIKNLKSLLSRCAYELPQETNEEMQQLKRRVEMKQQLAQKDEVGLSSYFAEWTEELKFSLDDLSAKGFLAEIIQKIELHPITRECRIHYKNGLIGKHRLVGSHRKWRSDDESKSALTCLP